MQYMTNLLIGDWSHDGHNMSDSVYIKSNLSDNEIDQAYQTGSKIVGFNLVKDICREYEDSILPMEHYGKLVDLGLKLKLDDKKYWNERGPLLWVDSYTEIYLFIVKLGNPDFVFEKIEPPCLKIGGYGLYSH